MNFQGKAVLVYLEEDNIARAYFRVQPLMTQDGPVGPVAAEFPDEGFLRIVPDKNEQHTFKERMRTLIGLCLVDLRIFPLEANKIRTNKNYSPLRGETNQYIVYSDAVRALPDDLLYQVVSENDVRNAITPFVYIRNGANIQGPFRREDSQSAGETAQLPPDSCEIHAVQVNGQELLFYWPRKAEIVEKAEKPETQAPAEIVSAPMPPEKKEEAPAPAAQPSALEQIQSMNAPVSENANRLQTSPAPAPEELIPEQNNRPLTGTRLYQAPQRQLPPRRAHNPLMEAVENQRYASRYETRYEAPGATIPQSAELREVNNPADALKRALQGMSHSPETQRQAADVILNESGMRVMLSRALAHEANDLTLAAMHSQLQELEAERLMTLMQLDEAKKNLAATHEEALGKLNMAEQKKLDQLHIAQQTAQNELDKLNKAIEPLEKKRQEAAEFVDAVLGNQDGEKRVLCPAAGKDVPKAELIERVEKCMKAAGFQMEEGEAQAMLTAFALSAETRTLQFRSLSPADAEYAACAFAAALGAEATQARSCDDFAVIPGGSAPLFVISDYQTVNHPLVFSVSAQTLGKAEDRDVWFTPHCDVPVYADPAALPGTLPDYEPVSLACVQREMLQETPLSDETKAVILSVRKALDDAGKPLPLQSVGMMARFIAATQNELKGGVAEAIDRACCLYVTAHALESRADLETIKPQLAAMPRALKALNA